jgi:hypothetical protein
MAVRAGSLAPADQADRVVQQACYLAAAFGIGRVKGDVHRRKAAFRPAAALVRSTTFLGQVLLLR